MRGKIIVALAIAAWALFACSLLAMFHGGAIGIALLAAAAICFAIAAREFVRDMDELIEQGRAAKDGLPFVAIDYGSFADLDDAGAVDTDRPAQ